MQLREFIDLYEQKSGYKAKRTGSGYQVRCNAHDDNRASLSIGEGNSVDVLITCHAGCTYDSVLASVGLRPEDLFENNEQIERREVCSYVYYDEDGVYLYEVVRFEPKASLPRRKSENGEWVWSLTEGLHYQHKNKTWSKNKPNYSTTSKQFPGTKRVLYNLPELIKRKEEPVVIVGGEKDVENLMKFGVLATTNQGGEGKWMRDYNKFLQGRRVIIIPDNDNAGREHARKVKNFLSGIASSVQIVELEGLDEKGDFSDWIKEHEIEELLDKIYGVPLPNAKTAELEVLKEIIKDNNVIDDVIALNMVDKFFFHSHRNVLRAMIECREEGLDINRITIANKLGNKLIETGGMNFLETLCE